MTYTTNISAIARFIFASIGITFSMIYIFLFLTRRRLRKSPGDIYLGMSIAEGLLAIH